MTISNHKSWPFIIYVIPCANFSSKLILDILVICNRYLTFGQVLQPIVLVKKWIINNDITLVIL